MKRRALNLVTVLSLLLCAAAAALWVRGRRAGDTVGWTNQQGDGWVLTTGGPAGGVEASVRRVTPSDGSGRRLGVHSAPRDPRAVVAGIRAKRLGFGAEAFVIHFNTTRGTQRMDWSGVVVPHWALVALFATGPALLAWKRLARRRRARNAGNPCAACGYDLTGNVSGVCPECGSRMSADSFAWQGEEADRATRTSVGTAVHTGRGRRPTGSRPGA